MAITKEMDSYQLYLALFTLLLFIFFFTKRLNSSNVKNSLPPSPPKLPILGNLHQLGFLPHHSLRALSRKYGPLMLLHLGSKPTLVVSSAEVAKEVLKINDLCFADRPMQLLSTAARICYYPKDVLGAPYGDQWRKSRSILVNQLLNNKRIKSFKSIIEDETTHLIEEIFKVSCYNDVNLANMLGSLVCDIISRVTFGKKLSAKDGERLVKAINEGVRMTMSFNIGDFIPWLSWVNKLNGFDAKLNRILKTRNEIIDASIQERLEGESSVDQDNKSENLLKTLLDIYMDDDSKHGSIDMDTVKALIMDVLVSATETTVSLLKWAMTELIRNPTIMKKLQDEIKEIINGKQDMIITDEDLKKMNYLKAVIKETLRFHPPITLIVRSSREYVNLMGYDIAANTGVIINLLAIGRDPAYWDEPEKFMPERFLNSSIDFTSSDFQFIPFGSGRRMCPGISYATEVVEYVLANLMQKFDWSLPKFGASVTRKKPLLVAATIRNS